MECPNCNRGMELNIVAPNPDGSQVMTFVCWGCETKKVHSVQAPTIDPGFDGLGICPHCEDVETLGGTLCGGCWRQYQMDNS